MLTGIRFEGDVKHNIDLIVIVIALAAFVVAAHAIRVPGARDANAVYDTPPYESRYASARW